MMSSTPFTVSLPLGLFGNVTLTAPRAVRVEAARLPFFTDFEVEEGHAITFGIDGCCDDIYQDNDPA
jgi:hypothetical protein